MISGTKVIKGNNTSRVTSSITRKTQQLNTQSSEPNAVNLSHRVDSVDRRNIYRQTTSLLPTY